MADLEPIFGGPTKRFFVSQIVMIMLRKTVRLVADPLEEVAHRAVRRELDRLGVGGEVDALLERLAAAAPHLARGPRLGEAVGAARRR